MAENDKKDMIVKAMTDLEYCPVPEDEINMEKYTKFPLAEISALGIAFEPLAAVFQKIAHSGVERAQQAGCIG